MLVLIALAAALTPRIPQDPAYHLFADHVSRFGIPNALNVLSNIPFLFAGVLGLWTLFAGRAKFIDARERWAYCVCFTGVTLTAFGSSWYHWSPDNATLVWDRLPMTLGFMGLLSAVIAERVSLRAGLALLGPLCVAGIASVYYWHVADDLRPYLLVQFGPMLLIPAMILLFPARYTLTIRYVPILAWYAAAKVLELLDKQIASWIPVSGHTLKHLAAAWACYEIVRMVRDREPTVR